jgi:predicted MFS family arabinose efflux permease
MPSTEPKAPNRGFRALLNNRSFMPLWIGQILSQLADKVFFVLLIATLENYHPIPGTENSMRSTLLLAFTIPAILFGSAGGVFVDRFSKKRILVGSDIIRGLLILLMPVLPREFLILLVLAFAISTVTQFFAPAEQAALPRLVPHDNLMAANALFGTTMMGALIVGFAIGEPILSWAKGWNRQYGQELLVGSLYLLSAVIIQPIRFPEIQATQEKLTTSNAWKELKDGLRYVKHNRLISSAMLQITACYCVFAALTVIAIALAKEIGLEPKQFGFLLAAAGIGMVFGGVILGQKGEQLRHKPLPLIGFLCMSFSLGVFPFTHNLLIGLGLCAFLGMGSAFIHVPMQTLIQQQTPPEMQGKVFGLQNNAVNIALSVPLAIAGPLTDALGLRNELVGMSVLVAIVGFWTWFFSRRVLQKML